MESQFPLEQKLFARFLKNRNSGRYQYLPDFSFTPTIGLFGPQALLFNQNIKMDFLTDSLMTEKITRELANNVTLRPYRYAVLGALSCSNTPIEEFIPEAKKSKFHLPLPYLLADTKKKSNDEILHRTRLLEQFLPGALQGRYVIQNKFFPNSYNDQAGRNFDVQRVSQLRYVAENNMVEMTDWFTPFNFNKPSYVPSISNRSLENYAWTELLDKVVDAALYSKYESARAKLAGNPAPGNLFYKLNTEKEVCEELKQKSLNSLM